MICTMNKQADLTIFYLNGVRFCTLQHTARTFRLDSVSNTSSDIRTMCWSMTDAFDMHNRCLEKGKQSLIGIITPANVKFI